MQCKDRNRSKHKWYTSERWSLDFKPNQAISIGQIQLVIGKRKMAMSAFFPGFDEGKKLRSDPDVNGSLILKITVLRNRSLSG